MERAGRAVADAVARHPPGHASSSLRPRQQWRRRLRRGAHAGERGYPVRVLLARRRRRAARRRGRGRADVARHDRAGRSPRRSAGAGVDRRCAVRRGPQPPGRGRRARDDRGDELVRRADRRGRPAERHQRRERRRDGRGREGAARASRSSAASPATCCCPAALHCGTVRVVDIGIPESVLERVRPRTFANAPALWGEAFPIPRLDGHKYSRGHAVVVSGEMASTGAARLAARGALRAGAGLVTLASPRTALAVNAAASLAVMVRAADGAAELRQIARRPPPQRGGAGAGRSGSARTRALLSRSRSRRARRRARRRCADELCGRPCRAVCGDRARARPAGRADAASRRVRAIVQESLATI